MYTDVKFKPRNDTVRVEDGRWCEEAVKVTRDRVRDRNDGFVARFVHTFYPSRSKKYFQPFLDQFDEIMWRISVCNCSVMEFIFFSTPCPPRN